MPARPNPSRRLWWFERTRAQYTITVMRDQIGAAIGSGPGPPAAAAVAVALAMVPAQAARPKYYFELHDVESRVPLNADMRQFAGEALKAELASRPEWQSDLGVK